MYFKRNTDLLPLGKPIIDNDWTNIVPIDIKNNTETKYDIESNTNDVGYQTKDNLIQIPIDNSKVAEIMQNTLTNAFLQYLWFQTKDSEVTYTTAKMVITTMDEEAIASEISSEYYPKALWFEVVVAKDENDKPVSITSDKVKKYQYKKLNGYNFLCNPSLMYKDDSEIDEEELDISVNTYIPFIKANTVYIDTLYSTSISTNNINIGNLYSNFARFNSMSINLANISAIMSDYAQQINYLHGINFYYPNKNLVFQNDLFVNEIETDNATIFNPIQLDTMNIKNLRYDNLDNLDYDNLGIDVSANIGFAGIAGYFVADMDLKEGELIRFGRTYTGNTHNNKNITDAIITKAGSDISGNVHGIVVPDSTVITVEIPGPEEDTVSTIVTSINLDRHGIVLNTDLKNRDPSAINGYLKLVHLYGISPLARIHGPTGIHEISNVYNNNTHKWPFPRSRYKHHKEGWEISGCCECSGDVGIGAKLYLSEISTGIFCTEKIMNTRTSNNCYKIPKAIVLEPTDNGSGLNLESGYTEVCANTPEVSAARPLGGRQAKVYFNVEL